MHCQSELAIGLMSGTSMDGIDAALVKIWQDNNSLEAKLLEFECYSYSEEVKETLLSLSKGINGGTREICLMQELLGKLYADACVSLCQKAGVDKHDISFVGCHGQTLWHQPKAIDYLGNKIRGTLQIGDPGFICEKMGCPVVSDFRPRDMAAGGQGAPIVPYTEFLLYREDKDVALLNIGGISNITILPAKGRIDDVVAFDTGPGNLLIDQMVRDYTRGEKVYDEGGKIALSGEASKVLLDYMMQDDYLKIAPPKSTGREHYNSDFVKDIYEFCTTNNISKVDMIATVSRYTAECVYHSVREFSSVYPSKLIVSGGGAHNEAIMSGLKELFLDCRVMKAKEAGINPDAKEAVAMAVLAHETMLRKCNNVPSVTGADHPVIMGRITY